MQSVCAANSRDVIFTPGAAGCTMSGTRLRETSPNDRNSNKTKTAGLISLTYLLDFRSQISSRSSLSTPNTEAHFGDHLMSYTAPWVELIPNTGSRQSWFHSWMVQSEEQLKNTSGLSGHHETQFTGL